MKPRAANMEVEDLRSDGTLQTLAKKQVSTVSSSTAISSMGKVGSVLTSVTSSVGETCNNAMLDRRPLWLVTPLVTPLLWKLGCSIDCGEFVVNQNTVSIFSLARIKIFVRRTNQKIETTFDGSPK
jgi:hypothetical protein